MLQQSLELEQLHRRVILDPAPQQPWPQNWIAVTFRPGRYESHFIGKRFVQLGTATLVQQRYCIDETAAAQIELTGYRRVETADGYDEYFSHPSLFHYNGLLAPRPGAQPPQLNLRRNPTLIQLLCFMHRECLRLQAQRIKLPTSLRLPTVWLGFSSQLRPSYECTPYPPDVFSM